MWNVFGQRTPRIPGPKAALLGRPGGLCSLPHRGRGEDPWSQSSCHMRLQSQVLLTCWTSGTRFVWLPTGWQSLSIIIFSFPRLPSAGSRPHLDGRWGQQVRGSTVLPGGTQGHSKDKANPRHGMRVSKAAFLVPSASLPQ